MSGQHSILVRNLTLLNEETRKMDETPNTRVQTPAAKLSYPHLFEPWVSPKNPGQPAQYSCTLVFIPAILKEYPKLGTDLKALKQVVVTAGRAKWAKFDEMVKAGKLKLPFRDDVATKGYPEGSIFINVRSNQKPGIVMPHAGPDGKPMQLTDTALIYPGAIVRASLTAFAYDNVGQGVSLALNNIQWLGHGDRLDNRVEAVDDFEAIEDAEPASIDDLL